MPRLGRLYPAFEAKIRRLPKRRVLTDQDLLDSRFRLEQDGPLEIYYAPMDWLRPAARIAIVGITPGKDTMRIAYQVAVDGLVAGRGAASILNQVKAGGRSSFLRCRARRGQWPWK